MRSRQLQGRDPRPSAPDPKHFFFLPQAPQTRPTRPSSLFLKPLGVLSPPLTPEDSQHSTQTQSEHVEPGRCGRCPHLARDVSRRGIMPPSSSPPSPPTRPVFTFPTLATVSNTEFTFSTPPFPPTLLSFEPSPPPSQSWKRRRATADVDGEHSCLHKKKRRLRLFLITSRLSPQFSHPATNIVDRGSSKIAVWAKQRAMGRNILRKAAILNRIRRQSISALETAGGLGLGRVLVEQDKEQEQLRLARLTLMYGSHDSATQPMRKDDIGISDVVETRSGERIRSTGSSPASSTGSPSPPLRACDKHGPKEYRSPNDAYAYANAFPSSQRPAHLPLPPSPLGLSNYDALDLEDEIPDRYALLDEEYDDVEEREGLDFESDYSPQPPFPCDDFETPTRQCPQHQSRGGILNPDEPVMGDYDRVENGADAIWPTAHQLDGRSKDQEVHSSVSPNIEAMSVRTSFDVVPRSPGAISSLSPTSSSPNFAGLFVSSGAKEPWRWEGHVEDVER